MKQRAALLIVTILGTALGTALAQPPRETPFTDVDPDSYAAEAIERVREAGIFIGFPDGTFRGDEPLTFAQAELVLTRLLEQTGIGSSTGQDVDTLVRALLSDLDAPDLERWHER